MKALIATLALLSLPVAASAAQDEYLFELSLEFANKSDAQGVLSYLYPEAVAHAYFLGRSQAFDEAAKILAAKAGEAQPAPVAQVIAPAPAPTPAPIVAPVVTVVRKPAVVVVKPTPTPKPVTMFGRWMAGW